MTLAVSLMVSMAGKFESKPLLPIMAGGFGSQPSLPILMVGRFGS